MGKENSNLELNNFKEKINLSEFAASYGYVKDKNKSTKSSVFMKNGTDKIVIAKSEVNHYIYFSLDDEKDNGTIIDFIQKRSSKSLGNIRNSLRVWLGFSKRPKVNPDSFSRSIDITLKNTAEILAQIYNFRQIKKDDSAFKYLNEYRDIHQKTLQNKRFFSKIFTDEFNNACFPHFYGKKMSGWEMKNKKYTGFVKAGKKAIWFSNREDTDKNIIVTESSIDALSHACLFPEYVKNSWYISTAGSFGQTTKKMLDAAFQKQVWDKIILAFDNDKQGRAFNERVSKLIMERAGQCEIQTPNLKDWNEDLIER